MEKREDSYKSTDTKTKIKTKLNKPHLIICTRSFCSNTLAHRIAHTIKLRSSDKSHLVCVEQQGK